MTVLAVLLAIFILTATAMVLAVVAGVVFILIGVGADD